MTLPGDIQLPRQQGVEQTLGAGLGQALGGSLQNLLGQYQQQQKIMGLAPILERYGLDENQIKQLSKSGISPDKITGILELLNEQQQLAQFYQSQGENIEKIGQPFQQNQNLNQADSLQEFQSATEIKPAPYTEEVIEENIEQSPSPVKPILASKQIFRPTRAKDIPDYQRNVMRAKEGAFNQNKDAVNEIKTSGNVAKENLQLVERGLDIVKRKGVGGLKGAIQEKLGNIVPFIRTPDVREYQRIQKNLTVGSFRKNFGARPAASEFFYITDVFGRAGDRREAIERSLLQEKWQLEIAAAKQEALQNILKQTQGEIPLNLDEMISAKVKPLYDKFLKDSGYYDWKKETLKKYNNKLRKNEVLMIYPNGAPAAVNKAEVSEAQNLGAFILQ